MRHHRILLALSVLGFALLTNVGSTLARPQSCMPNAPYGRAPQWAVDVVKQRGGNIATSPEDPVWQNAVCDKAKHTVEWHLPGEDESAPSKPDAAQTPKMHRIIIAIGETMQRNLVCK